MNMKFIWSLIFFLLTFAADAENGPCGGKQMLLSLINRPSFSDSACIVPSKKLLIEGGFQNQQIIGGGTQVNSPELDIRIGLAQNTEFDISPSNYIHQTIFPFSGTTPTWLGLKHRFFYNKNWIVTGEGFISPPSGNKDFGSPHVEAALNGILFHQINDQFSWQVQMGVNELSDPETLGGQKYRSFNPSLVISYTIKKKINTYLEFFGQTKTSSTQSFGLIGGGGIIYFFNSRTTFDIAFYQRITGQLLGFEHFIGAGTSRLFQV